MKYINNRSILFAMLVMLIGFTSCEDVIELDLENAEPRLVIEANLDANTNSIGVFITQSNGFYEDINLNTVESATVTLTLADGSAVSLNHIENGFYSAINLGVETGDELSIEVLEGDQEYQATAVVPHAIQMDSLEVIETTDGGPGNGGPISSGDDVFFQVFTHWEDVADVESFYRIRYAVNDTLQAYIYNVTDDVLFDGASISRPSFQPFNQGDTLTVQLMSIDKQTYQYYSDLSAIQGQGASSTTPYNPKSNFNNGALGYFGIFRADARSVILE